MRKLGICLSLFAIGLLGFGCSQEDTVQPDLLANGDVPAAADAVKRGRLPLDPGKYYSFFYSEETGSYSELSSINTHNGEATFVWRVQIEYAGDGETTFGWIPFGLAFDVDGTMYTTENMLSFDPELVQSRFVRLDSETGEVTPIGGTVPFNTAGGDIDACGNYYVCGFQVDALGYIWGNSSLWRIDKVTGEFFEIGDTGHTNWMDLAFDAEGTLWGTFDNELYVIDTEIGASSLVTEIHGVPDSGEPHFMEVMSIAFDKHDVLYGTGLTVYYDHPEGSPVMRIDVNTGEATLLGYSQTALANHGGDIMPARVKVAHLNEYGEFECKTISMNALPAHLAHGDYVPGAAGYDCECPEVDFAVD